MIRNAMFGLFGLSLLALSAGSVLAAPVSHHVTHGRVVAQASAPAGDSSAPATNSAHKADKKGKKATRKDTAGKADVKTNTKTEGAKEMKVPAAAPAATK